MEEKEKMKVKGKAGKENGHYNNMNFCHKYSKLVMNFTLKLVSQYSEMVMIFSLKLISFFVFMIRILLTTSQKSPRGFRAYCLFSFWTKVFNFDVHYFDCTYKGMSLFTSPLRVRAFFHKTVRVCHVYCNFKIGFTCWITVIFGTLKEGSLLINTLASNICFSYRNMFQNGVDALSKIVDAFLSKSSKFHLVRIIR